MSNLVRMQLRLNATPEQAYHALIRPDALTQWFCEFAHVGLDANAYDFWGKFTPDAPTTQAEGHHTIAEHTAQRHLAFDWHVKNTPTQVNFKLLKRDQHTLLTLRHMGTASGSHSADEWTLEDFWFLSLENLRRHLDGKPAEARVDFSASMNGDIRHETIVDAPASRVFEVLLRPAEIERWIASRATIVPEVGGTYDLGWGAGVGGVKILELVPDKKLALGWGEGGSGGENPLDTTVLTWSLEENGGKTRVTFVHSGFAPDKPNGGIKAGWRNFLNWVRSIAEYGADWQPPLTVLSTEMYPYYAASISRAQNEIVAELRDA